MSLYLQLAAWVLVGTALANLHLWLLHRALARSRDLAPAAAGRYLVHGMWLRVTLWLPALVLAATHGLWACLGLVAGSLAGRWLAYRWAAAQ